MGNGQSPVPLKVARAFVHFMARRPGCAVRMTSLYLAGTLLTLKKRCAGMVTMPTCIFLQVAVFATRTGLLSSSIPSLVRVFSNTRGRTAGERDLHKRLQDIIGRRPSGHCLLPARITNELEEIVKRVFPLTGTDKSPSNKTHAGQDRFHLPAVRTLWNGMKQIFDEAGEDPKRPRQGNLHIKCKNECTSKVHTQLNTLYKEYEDRGKCLRNVCDNVISYSRSFCV